MVNVTGDKLTMLLSTDWFFDYWPVIGLMVPDEGREAIQGVCRIEVERLMGGEESYWHTSFADERITGTRSRLCDAFRNKVADPTVIGSLLGTDSAQHGSIAANSSSLLSSLTQLIVSDPESGGGLIGADLQGKLTRAWNISEGINIDFHALCEHSQTKWDKYIRSLTSDLPTMLADFLAVEILTRDRFAAFWISLDKGLSSPEKISLIKWYETTATMLTDQHFQVPAWMTEARPKSIGQDSIET